MNQTQSLQKAVAVSIAAGVIVAAAFMPWGEISGTPNMPNFPNMPGMPGGTSMMGGMQMTITVTGWNGNITLAGLKLPNWLVVLAAGVAVALVWCESARVWRVHPVVPSLLALYGLLHSGFAVFVLMGSDRGSAGVGSILTALAFAGMLVFTARDMFQEPAVSRGRPPAA